MTDIERDNYVHPGPRFSENGINCGFGQGMSLRDYFAWQAMAAIISKTPFQEFPKDFSPYEKTAIGAYDYADAMLAKRNTG